MELLTTLSANLVPLFGSLFDFGGDAVVDPSVTETAKGVFLNLPGVVNLLVGFLINLLFVGIVVRCFYYPKCKRGEIFFTFILIAISIFLLIYLLGGVKLKTGFALGLFAIFSIIRYRTEQVAIREMTYLFIIIAMSAINVRKFLLQRLYTILKRI